MDSDQDAIEAFQKALSQAQNDSEPKQTPAYAAAEGNSDGELMFSGSVSPDTSTPTQSNPALFTVYEEKEVSSNQFWGLFLMGLIVLPAITWITSITIIESSEYEDGLYYESNRPIYTDNVTIGEEIYYVHEFHLGDGFSNELEGNLGVWAITVEGIVGNETVAGRGVIRGFNDAAETDLGMDDEGNLWHKMDFFFYAYRDDNWNTYYDGYCEWEGDAEEWESDTKWWCKYDADDEEWDDWWYYCEHHDPNWYCTDVFGQSEYYEHSAEGSWWSTEPELNEDLIVYIKFDGDTVDVATQNSTSPTEVNYWSEEIEDRGNFEFLPLVIWPISFIGGIIWGFKTDRKPFAYGIMTAGLLALVLPFVALIIIVMFFGYY